MCLSTSPVQSVIFLILSFCCAAIILFMFHVEFIGLLFIIIYVGAIAVLFLFVIMMLNVKNNQMVDELNNNNFSVAEAAVLVFIGVYPWLLQELYRFAFLNKDIKLEVNYESLIYFTDEVSNVEVIGQILFNNFLLCVLLAGMVLLIALVGSIILTLKFNKTEKKQIANRQLARNENFITFFK